MSKLDRKETCYQEFVNRPIAKIVCWKCKSNSNGSLAVSKNGNRTGKGVTLFRLRFEDGRKSPDYACEEHKSELPPISNCSYIKFPTAMELVEMMKSIGVGDSNEFRAAQVTA